MVEYKNIVEKGEEVKYKITIDQTNFLMADNDFKVILTYGMMGKKLTIEKSEMISNADGEWFFVFDSSDMIGRVKAECIYDVPDEDYPDGYRTEVNRQTLCVVISHPLPAKLCVPAADPQEGQTVIYERTDASSVEQLYSYLTDRDGNYLVTADGDYLLVLRDN